MLWAPVQLARQILPIVPRDRPPPSREYTRFRAILTLLLFPNGPDDAPSSAGNLAAHCHLGFSGERACPQQVSVPRGCRASDVPRRDSSLSIPSGAFRVLGPRAIPASVSRASRSHLLRADGPRGSARRGRRRVWYEDCKDPASSGGSGASVGSRPLPRGQHEVSPPPGVLARSRPHICNPSRGVWTNACCASHG
jgi:hypothetical protein